MSYGIGTAGIPKRYAEFHLTTTPEIVALNDDGTASVSTTVNKLDVTFLEV
jgi:hypothetical protein